MKRGLKNKVDLFLQNKKKIKATFKFEDETSCLLDSFLYTDIDKVVDENKLMESYNIIRKRTSLFSDYRFLSLIIAGKMALRKKPEDYFNEVDNTYNKIKRKVSFSSIYSILTSMILCDYTTDNNITKYVNREKKIFDLLNKNHPILTSEDDAPYAMLLALSDKKEEKLVKESEEIYQILTKNIKHSKDACQAMANILVLYDKSVEEKTNKMIEIYKLLKESKKNIEDKFILTVLSTLIFVDKTPKEIVKDILDVDTYIGTKEGTGLWLYGKLTRLMFSILLVESAYGDPTYVNAKNSVAISSVVAEQVVTLILVTSMLLLMD